MQKAKKTVVKRQKKFLNCGQVLVFLLYLYYNVDKSGAKWHEVDKQCLNGGDL